APSQRSGVDLLEMGIAVPLSVEGRDVMDTAVVAQGQPVALRDREKSWQQPGVAVDVVMGVDVRRHLPAQLDETLELPLNLCLRLPRCGSRRARHGGAAA